MQLQRQIHCLMLIHACMCMQAAKQRSTCESYSLLEGVSKRRLKDSGTAVLPLNHRIHHLRSHHSGSLLNIHNQTLIAPPLKPVGLLAATKLQCLVHKCMDARQRLEEAYKFLLVFRVDEDLQSLGFDSSLMDLVAEVEQMVAFKQANAGPADRQPAGRQHLSPRAALLHRLPSTQVACC